MNAFVLGYDSALPTIDRLTVRQINYLLDRGPDDCSLFLYSHRYSFFILYI